VQECGLTLDALGERVGLSASAVSLIESGKREAKVSTLAALADALECQLFGSADRGRTQSACCA
jgi:transcriptional regulator with XRE-family HTH domain